MQEESPPAASEAATADLGKSLAAADLSDAVPPSAAPAASAPTPDEEDVLV